MGLLDGKVAFITGAGRGQGRASALRLAEEGADIIALDVASNPLGTLSYELASAEDLDETVDLVRQRGRRAVRGVADVQDPGPDDVRAAFAGLSSYGGRVAGKVVVVTGAARGQGAAEARLLAAEGATVIGLDVLAPTDEAPGVEHHTMDVADPVAWEHLAADLARRHRAVHGLVNNAAITDRTFWDEITAERMSQVLAINVTGAMLGIQALVRLMTEGGSIVNVSSIAGLTGHFPPAYTASKWALRGLSRSASAEFGRFGIRVNAIMPGVIQTPMAADAPEVFTRLVTDDIPLGRRGTAEDVAPLVLFLISEESAWISGAEIAIDGGQAGHGGMKRLSDAVRTAAAAARTATTNTHQEGAP
jgi:3alpha(or 20beta)-hydroxysteroid dehydrogenase